MNILHLRAYPGVVISWGAPGARTKPPYARHRAGVSGLGGVQCPPTNASSPDVGRDPRTNKMLNT